MFAAAALAGEADAAGGFDDKPGPGDQTPGGGSAGEGGGEIINDRGPAQQGMGSFCCVRFDLGVVEKLRSSALS